MARLTWRARRLVNRFRASALILLYHRVAQLASDPFEQALSASLFEEHLEVLTKCAHPISLQTLLAALDQQRVPKGAVVVTFDDGYSDNLYVAKPLLEKYGIPATIFVSTTPVRQGSEFFWDALEHLLLHARTLPDVALLKLHGIEIGDAIGVAHAAYDIGANLDWRFSDGSDPTTRHRLFRKVYLSIRELPAAARDEALNSVRQWASISALTRDEYRPLDGEEVARLAKGNLVELGAHTRSHAFLPALSSAEQRQEIEGGKLELESMAGVAVRSFSYPYGKLSNDTSRLVRQAGYVAACTTHAAAVRRGADAYRLPRIWPRNCDGDRLVEILRQSFVL